MRALVCGGRNFTDRDVVFKALDVINAVEPISVVIDGAARGVDSLAAEWAIKNELWNFRFPAKWKQYENKAGPLRNRLMMEKARPHFVVVFPGGAGTADMENVAREAGVDIYRVSVKGEVTFP